MTQIARSLRHIVPLSLMLAGAATALAFPPTPAAAQGLGGSAKSMLANATDTALDKLAQPGAFYADKAVRIALPGPLKSARGLMGMADKLGVTSGLAETLNDAAGRAANEAKPIFRSAIDDMTLSDGIGIARKKNGATRYLRSSAGGELQTKLRPLIAAALGELGAFKQLDKLGAGGGITSTLGVDRDGLTDSVTEQALDGIFTYIAAEETNLRANPLNVGKKILGKAF